MEKSPANNNEPVKNISGMTPKQVMQQEVFVSDILDIMAGLEELGIDPE